MNTEHKVIATTEIVGALMTNQLDNDARKQLKDDPQAYILSKSNVDVTTKIAIVENSADSVALALPYYESLNTITMKGMNDADLDDVSGGEIVMGVGLAVANASNVIGANAGAIGIAIGGAHGADLSPPQK